MMVMKTLGARPSGAVLIGSRAGTLQRRKRMHTSSFRRPLPRCMTDGITTSSVDLKPRCMTKTLFDEKKQNELHSFQLPYIIKKKKKTTTIIILIQLNNNISMNHDRYTYTKM